jgi:hypothetical protein
MRKLLIWDLDNYMKTIKKLKLDWLETYYIKDLDDLIFTTDCLTESNIQFKIINIYD